MGKSFDKMSREELLDKAVTLSTKLYHVTYSLRTKELIEQTLRNARFWRTGADRSGLLVSDATREIRRMLGLIAEGREDDMPALPREILGPLADYRSGLHKIVAELAAKHGIEPEPFNEWTRIVFDNGAGDSAIWFFGGPANDMLLLTYDHESRLNFYDDNAEAQLRLYDGLPPHMMALVTGQQDDHAWVTMPVADTTVVAATGVFSPNLSSGPDWEPSDGLQRQFDDNGANMQDTGFTWLMDLVGLPKESPA